jgi:hypothetical protein
MRRSFILALVLSLAALPAFASNVVYGGTDLWVTPANGSTYSDFAANPIPSGFFCSRSQAFTGKIVFKGAPLASDSPEVTLGADTIIQRLDDAVFDDSGKASTRLQVKALHLVSLAPVKTACGDWNVRASLTGGDQPVTRMRIFRDHGEGGRFVAPLALNVKLTFSPVGRAGRSLELVQQVRLSADPRATWIADQNKTTGRYFRIDTNGDGRADTLVPGPSNFRAGIRSQDKRPAPGATTPINPAIDPDTPGYETVHTSPTHVHGTVPPPPCGNPESVTSNWIAKIAAPCNTPPES